MAGAASSGRLGACRLGEGDGLGQHRLVADMVGEEEDEAGVEGGAGWLAEAAMGLGQTAEGGVGIDKARGGLKMSHWNHLAGQAGGFDFESTGCGAT